MRSVLFYPHLQIGKLRLRSSPFSLIGLGLTWPTFREHVCLFDGGVGERDANGFLFHLLPGSPPGSPGLCQAWLPGSCLLLICPSSDHPCPVLQAEGWVWPSWFQLGTRKLARGIFSPGFWRSQRSFILGGTGHSGTQLANTGLMGCREDRLQGREWGQGEGANVTLSVSVAQGNSGDASPGS